MGIQVEKTGSGNRYKVYIDKNTTEIVATVYPSGQPGHAQAKSARLNITAPDLQFDLETLRFQGENFLTIAESDQLPESALVFKNPSPPACYYGTEDGKAIPVNFSATLRYTGEQGIGNSDLKDVRLKAKVTLGGESVATLLYNKKGKSELKGETGLKLKEVKDKKGYFETQGCFHLDHPAMPAAWVTPQDNQDRHGFHIELSLSKDEGETWLEEELISVKKEALTRWYVTYRQPIRLVNYLYEVSLQMGSLDERYLYYSCRQSHGLPKRKDIVQKIWEKFCIPYIDQEPSVSLNTQKEYPLGNLLQSDFGMGQENQLSYYHYEENMQVASSVEELLDTNRGDCFAFSELLNLCFQAEGIDSIGYKVDFKKGKLGENISGVLIKGWKFTSNGTSDDPEYPFVSIFRQGVKLDSLFYDHQGNYKFDDKLSVEANRDCEGKDHLKGHNNPCAPGNFSMHRFVKCGGRLYDPSYGKVFSNFEAWEKAAVAGYYRAWRDEKYTPGEIRTYWEVQKKK
ncbi:hypothetical protein AAG747_11025 [Rapidithrix thailandica]|uniref:Transglutaminase-like domain-containing protein n=1 Tax=Rapidithrix thailandica TaxID=413964 RepID=A0AAW9RUL9_9BACT